MFEEESVDDVENNLEVILDADQTGDIIGEENDDNQEQAEGYTERVKPKRVVKNPQPKLNEQTLKGPRGLVAIENYFEMVPFKGRGYEEQDLNTLLKAYEYWCHHLFPKFPFDSCVARLEKLGTKRATQIQIKKNRMGLMFDGSEKVISEEEVNDNGEFVDPPVDQFDQLVSDVNESEIAISDKQLELIRQNMEKAKQLREARLKTNEENFLNNLYEHDQVDFFRNESVQFSSSTPVSNCRHTQKNGNEVQLSNEIQSQVSTSNEDDFENILSYINSDITDHNDKETTLI